MPDIRVGGMIWGDRLTRFKKYMVFNDMAHSLKAVINFGVTKLPNGKTNTKKADNFYGKVYSYQTSKKPLVKEEEVLKMGDLVQEYHEITGSYMENIIVDGKERWNMTTDKPEMIQPLENALPSDWRFREDLIWLHYQ